MTSALLRLVLAMLLSYGIEGTDGNTVVLVNETGLKIVRIVIGQKVLEDVDNKTDKILVEVTPGLHNMELVFRGGSHIDWADFDFRGVHKVIFQLVGHKVLAKPQ